MSTSSQDRQKFQNAGMQLALNQIKPQTRSFRPSELPDDTPKDSTSDQKQGSDTKDSTESTQ